MRLPTTQKGFTLIEAVVATSVFAFVVSSILGVYVSAIQLDRKTRGQRAVTQNARFIMEFFAKEVRNGTVDYASFANGTVTGTTDLYLKNESNVIERFSLSGTDLVLTKSGTTTNLNSAAVKVTNLKFFIKPTGDPFAVSSTYNEQPHVTVVLGLQSNYGQATKDLASIAVQDTFSAREYPSRMIAGGPTPTPPPPMSVKVLVVGGGGGGGYFYGGGGGAGGYQYDPAHAVTAQTYNVTVGNGGLGVNSASKGNNGASSIFDNITATGGGGGGYDGFAGNSGGSGGGGGGNAGSVGGTGSQGFNGESGAAGFNGGGGGGAGESGGTDGAGFGGDGIANSISGTSVIYAGGGAGLSSGQDNTASRGTGGGGMSDENGVANTGGGGGFAWNGPSGAGGKGIVIISYPSANITGATGGTITYTDSNNQNSRSSPPYAGGNTIHTFTSSGTFTIP